MPSKTSHLTHCLNNFKNIYMTALNHRPSALISSFLPKKNAHVASIAGLLINPKTRHIYISVDASQLFTDNKDI